MPGLLLDQQDTDRGGFYWRFDHTDGMTRWEGPDAGFTEDTAFALLGLAALRESALDVGIELAIVRARRSLLESIDGAGGVRGHLIEASPRMHVYAGEALTALCAVAERSDLDLSGRVAVGDLQVLAEQWLTEGLGLAPCQCADLDGDGRVSMADFLKMSQAWKSAQGDW